MIMPLMAFSATVKGVVTNRTTNKPDTGDDVILLSLSQGMQEAARTKVDATGHFSIDVPDSNMHLIRVDHQQAPYFAPLPPGTNNVNVDVYDAAPQVKGVSTEADVMRIETDQRGLHVIENYFVKNSSSPPLTQFSNHSYELWLQPGAQIEGAAAKGPGGMPVASSPMPLAEKGHYAFVFPIRPGETQFQLSYYIPYKGSYKFDAHIVTATDNVAIILPKSMQFDGGSFPFQSINDDVNAQTFLARGVKAGQTLAFTVSGTGSQPREEQGAEGAQNAQAAAGEGGPAPSSSAAQDTRPGGGLGTPIDTPDPLQKYKWWILSGLAIVLVIAAAFFLRAKPEQATEAAVPLPSPLTPTPVPSGFYEPGQASPNGAHAVAGSSALLAALKDELFMLESERLEGKLDSSEYAELKAAFEVVLRRALSRQTTEK
ncbi:carboxypeptidase regulatory-like domain-containing protein [Acidipila sp. 4G-K13]|uniref:Carboxypeptidase regulatory-like domain-containing protein n=2 Tax=Paracidobacterium acidisoli TaxID=2303751 RepID=A0A372IUT6_9BACT|nr:carboxypeptidase regulatory-like domain-containing protein [Paracidobacterium acidisoli]